jgi:hypothetical protein
MNRIASTSQHSDVPLSVDEALPANKKTQPRGWVNFSKGNPLPLDKGWFMVLVPCAYPLSSKVRSTRSWWASWLDPPKLSPQDPRALAWILQLRDSAGLDALRKLSVRLTGLPPSGPAHPGYGAPRSLLFGCETTIPHPFGAVNHHPIRAPPGPIAQKRPP